MQGKAAEPLAARPRRNRWRRTTLLIAVHLAMGVVLAFVVAQGFCAVGASNWYTRLAEKSRASTGPTPMRRGPVLKGGWKLWDGMQWCWQENTFYGVGRCFSQVQAPLGNRTIEPGVGDDAPLPPSWAVCRDLSVVPDAVRNPDRHFWLDSAYGWPWLCLHEQWEYNAAAHNRSAYTRPNSVQITIPFLKSRFNHDGYWPTHVLWPGMLGNVCAWSLIAAVPWGLVTFARRARVRRRMRLGRCAACGYDTSSLPPGAACPECGARDLSGL